MSHLGLLFGAMCRESDFLSIFMLFVIFKLFLPPYSLEASLADLQ